MPKSGKLETLQKYRVRVWVGDKKVDICFVIGGFGLVGCLPSHGGVFRQGVSCLGSFLSCLVMLILFLSYDYRLIFLVLYFD